MRDMGPVENEFRERGVAFLAVNVFESAEQGRSFIERSDLDYTWLRAEGDTLETLGVRSVPSLILLDGEGQVAWRSGLFALLRGEQEIRRALERVTD